jgi:hypothetical protein
MNALLFDDSSVLKDSIFSSDCSDCDCNCNCSGDDCGQCNCDCTADCTNCDF